MTEAHSDSNNSTIPAAVLTHSNNPESTATTDKDGTKTTAKDNNDAVVNTAKDNNDEVVATDKDNKDDGTKTTGNDSNDTVVTNTEDNNDGKIETTVNDNNKGTDTNIDPSSDSSRTNSENTNQEYNTQLNSNDLCSVQNKSSAEIENKTSFADTSVESPTDSNELLTTNEDANHTENTRTDSSSFLEKGTSVGDVNGQNIDNNSNVPSSLQANQRESESVSSKTPEEESTLTGKNMEPASIDEIHLSFQENNAKQGGDNHDNQISGQKNEGEKKIDDIKQQENDLNTFLPLSVNDQNGGIDRKKSVAINTPPPITGSPLDDSEDSSSTDPNLVSVVSLSNNGTPVGKTLNTTTVDEAPPENQIDYEKSAQKAFNEAIINDLSVKGTPDQRMNNQNEGNNSTSRHLTCQFHSDKKWLDPQYNIADGPIKKPNQIEDEMNEPPVSIDEKIQDRIQGSIIGMALGDALGAHVEFRPHQYLVAHPVKDLGSGGTWGLERGQFTDDTSMALCLANSLIACRGFVPYDQLVRYKWWYKLGYMSSTGQCFDIGSATRQSISEFEYRQQKFSTDFNIPFEDIDYLSEHEVLEQFDVDCSEDQVAGNGALMRLAPVPLFFFRYPATAVEFSGRSGEITHGDRRAYDACRYYGALIVAALHGYTKHQLLDTNFYSNHRDLFGEKELHADIKSIAEGSFKKENGYEGGIRGKGYIVQALEAALWAFWSDGNSFETGALAAVNLGDDTDTTAAIYGQLAGAYYGYQKLPKHWVKDVYGRKFMEKLSKWIAYEGECWQKRHEESVSKL